MLENIKKQRENRQQLERPIRGPSKLSWGQHEVSMKPYLQQILRPQCNIFLRNTVPKEM